MNYCSSQIIAFLTPIFCTFQEERPVNDDFAVYLGKTVKMTVPEFPLAPGALQITSDAKNSSFSNWQVESHIEAYNLMQRIAQVWEKQGVSDYLIFAKDTPQGSFRWEIVPYPKDGWRIWKQIKVALNIVFGGGSRLSNAERNKQVIDFQKIGFASSGQHAQVESIDKVAKSNDAFCNPEIIQKQLVFEGKKINVLYNYAPIAVGNEKLHFLLTPKAHREGFLNLTEEEYLEAMQLSQRLVAYYLNKGYQTAYIFDKNGYEAGQTVPHWHEHIVFTASSSQEFGVLLQVLKTTLIGTFPLSKGELQARVSTLKKELECELSEK